MSDAAGPGTLGVLIVVTGAAVLLPPVALLVAWLPVLVVVSYVGPGPVAQVAGAEVQLYDVLMAVVAVRLFIRSAQRRESPRVSPVYVALALFALALMASTAIAGWRFGDERVTDQIIALLRLVGQMLVVLLVAESARRQTEVQRSLSAFRLIGFASAGSVYLAGLLFTLGYVLGDVQASAIGVRLFGPVGDQIGFIILLFLLWELARGRIPHALFLGGAMLLTGTRGSLLSALVGVVHLAARRTPYRTRRRLSIAVAAMSALLIIGLATDVAGIRERSALEVFGEGSLAHRLIVQTVAARVFLDNLLFGVGFGGFRQIADDYLSGSSATAFGLLPLVPQFFATTANQYLQTATDAGLPGLVLLMWLLVVLARTIVAAQRVADPATGSFLRAAHSWLVAQALGNQFAVWIYPGSLITLQLWIVVGLAVAARRLGPRFDTVASGQG